MLQEVIRHDKFLYTVKINYRFRLDTYWACRHNTLVVWGHPHISRILADEQLPALGRCQILEIFSWPKNSEKMGLL